MTQDGPGAESARSELCPVLEPADDLASADRLGCGTRDLPPMMPGYRQTPGPREVAYVGVASDTRWAEENVPQPPAAAFPSAGACPRMT